MDSPAGQDAGIRSMARRLELYSRTSSSTTDALKLSTVLSRTDDPGAHPLPPRTDTRGKLAWVGLEPQKSDLAPQKQNRGL